MIQAKVSSIQSGVSELKFDMVTLDSEITEVRKDAF